MTIANAFKAFVRALTGQTPVGDTIAEIINDGANKVGAISGTNGLDLGELNTSITTLNTNVTAISGDLTDLDAEVIKYDDSTNKSFVLNSSTASSTKSFTITVDDTGTLTATEIVPETPGE